MVSEQIRQQKRNSVVQTVLTVVILLFTAIHIPMSSYYSNLPQKLQIKLGILILIFFGASVYIAVQINKENLREVFANTFRDEKLSSKVEK